MTTFLWVFVVTVAIECVGLITILGTGRYTKRQPASTAMSLIFGIAWLAWALWLLAKV